MSPRTPKLLRTVTFAGSPGGMWGAACDCGGAFLAVGEGPTALLVPGAGAELTGASSGESWTLGGPGVEVSVEPIADPVASERPEGFDQLCRVRGRIAAEDAERTVDVLGRRCAMPGVDIADLDSVRDVSAYFEPADGIAVTALRPRRRRGHDRDVVLAAVLEEGSGHEVEDPRLSTTYTGSGDPWRVGVELWLTGEDESTQYPVRAAGEADGTGARETIDGIELYAGPLRWHSRGRLGGGVYLLLRAR
jgi:hypothetical protein